ncbi:Derlin-1 [Pitangus sulphuratus]|nr:Derlin-1 [Pitangus sulphuratus]
MSDLGDWFRSIPLITRYWFAGSIAVPLVGKLGLVSPVSLFLWPDAFIHRFQIWRPITATFFFPVGPGTGFLYLVNLYFLYQYSSRLETGAFDGRPADYMFMLLFNWICIVLLMIPLIMSVLYVWAQLNRDMIVSFWFGTRFKACYLPWVILGFNYIIGGSVINELIGNLVGHLYFFLMFKYPVDLGGRNFLSTPQFLYRWLPNRRGGVSGFGVPPASMRRAAEDQQGGGRHNWGQGFRLGVSLGFCSTLSVQTDVQICQNSFRGFYLNWFGDGHIGHPVNDSSGPHRSSDCTCPVCYHSGIKITDSVQKALCEFVVLLELESLGPY